MINFVIHVSSFKFQNRGFTLIELLLVVGILAVVFGLALPFALNTKFTNELDTATENLITTLREAQSQAIAAEGDTPYGVYFDTLAAPPTHTIYKGASWLSKDESFNVGGYGTTELPKSATLKFNWPVPDTTTPSETTFARLTGQPPSTITELSATTNIKALYHFNSTSGAEANKEGKELALGDLGTGVADSNLKGLWHLNEVGGLTADDSSSNGNTGFISGQNLLSNGGFETYNFISGKDDQNNEESFGSWSKASSGISLYAVTGSSSPTALKATYPGPGNNWITSNSFSVTNGATYTISFYAKADSPITGKVVYLQEAISPWAIENNIYVTFNVTTSWQRYSVTGKWTKAAITAKFVFYPPSASDTGNAMYYDDVIVRKAVAGKFGNTLSFNGTSYYVSVINESNFDFDRTQPFSVDAWIKTSATSGKIVSKMPNSAPYPGFELYVSAGKLYAQLGSTWSTNWIQEYSSVSINDNIWHYVAMTYDGSSSANGLKLFIDGAEVATTVAYDTLSASILNNTNLQIGVRDNSTTPFNGSIDEVAVYNTVLGAPAILDHYRRGIAEDATISETSGNTFGPNDGNIYGPVTTAGHTNLNQALSFDGADDYVSIPTSTDFNFSASGSFSFFMWFKKNTPCESVETNKNEVFASRFGTYDDEKTWWFGCSGTTYLNKLILNAYPDTTGLVLQSINTINDGKWHYGGWVYDGTLNQWRLYMDGVLQDEYTDSSAFIGSFDVSNPLYLGRYGNGGYYADGIFDEAAIYNIALDAATIATHASTLNKTITISIPDVGNKIITVTTNGLIY